VELGINHEQQHQELILTDIKHVFSVNPLRPALRERAVAAHRHDAPQLRWLEFGERVDWIGHDGAGFAYDNEGPRHKEVIHDFALASRAVTNGEYLDFMMDRGYQRADLWLSDGWATVNANGWTEPFYWERRDDEWWSYTLTGMQRINPAEPVCHVSYYEADAFARWAGARLPSEAEWELAYAAAPVAGHFAEACDWLPQHTASGFGSAWAWTASPYVPYPGFRPADGAVGEYNGKFMCNQMVLRGGSCFSPQSHLRASYRNFFPPAARWQVTGIRLAR
jgi:ergothioneine biosynthesis protein EgtB